MTKKSIAGWGLLCILFTVYLFFGDFLIVGIVSRISNIKMVQSSAVEYESNTPGFAEFKDYVQKTGLLRTGVLNGFAAIPIDSDLEEKEAKFVLIGENHRYEIEGEFTWALGVDQHFSLPGITDNNRLITAEFSTIPIVDGIYQVYIFAKEKSDVYGLFHTGMALEKRNDGLYEYIPPEIEPIEAQVDDRINWAAFSRPNAVSDGYYAISGLVMKKDTDSRTLNAYVEAITREGEVHTFPAMLQVDQWYNSYFDSDLYTYSKIVAKVPVELLLGKEAQVNFIVDDAGTMGKTEGYDFAFDENGYRRIYTGCIKELPYQKEEVGNITHTQWNDLEKERTESYFFNGIAFVKDKKLKSPKIYLRFEYEDGSKLIYPAQVSENNWVQDKYGEDYKWSTYSVEIGKEDFRQETTKLYICIGDGDVVYQTAKPIVYTWEDGSFVKKG